MTEEGAERHTGSDADGPGTGSGPRAGSETHARRHHLFVETDDDDWAWRRRIRSNPTLALPYRIGVLVIGLAITVGGLILVPLPGPGWLIVFFGIAVLGSEFEPAQRLLDWGKGVLHRWNEWVKAQPWWGQGLIGLATAALVLAVIWAVLKVGGLPGFVPDSVATWLQTHAAL